ncbi:hemerythrin domain-containing protein [Azoarcus indigens]|nr:hemerythrin domain-containing protein [Azoarcus indigens]
MFMETEMPVMQWSEQLELGLGRMDDTHREFVEYYNALASASPETFLQRLDAFIEHTIAHFDQENRWMEQVGFPGCHRAEHDRVLAVMHEVRARVEKGDKVLGMRLVEELPPWFENHAGGMDAALAFHLQSIGFDVEKEGGGIEPGGCGPASCTCGGAASKESAAV